MKKYVLLLLLFIPLHLFATHPPNTDSLWFTIHYNKIERYITMRDGVKLFTSIYIPKDESSKHPIMLNRTPYSCAPYGEHRYTSRYAGRGDSTYFHRDYIMVYQDVRGRFMSEGDFEDVRPFMPVKKSKKDVDESTDAYDTIDWLIKNIKNNNGKVGCFGISYPGFYATQTALSNHPALKAVSPQAPVTDWFIGDDFHHKGVMFLMDNFGFFRGFGMPRPKPLTTYPEPAALKIPDSYSFFLREGTFLELKNKYMGDSIKFWNDVAAHPDYDDWWKARDARSGCYNIKPAMLIVGGLFDAEDCWGGWNLYKAIEAQSPTTDCKIVEGPWFHGGWARSTGEHLGNVWFEQKTSSWYRSNIELPFFEYHLNGKGSLDRVKEATIFITGENKWHQFEVWPPENTSSMNLYLQAGGMAVLGNEQGQQPDGIAPGFDEYVSDPMKPVPYTEDVHGDRTREYMTDDQRFAARRTDVLVYQTGILENDITLTGPVVADLFASISTTDADFVVKLIDVFPDDFEYPDSVKINYPMGGYQMLVRGEIMRARYRNSFSAPEAMVPGKVTEVKFELPDVAHTFKKGHRIMIQVQSTWYPLADRNPQQFIDPYKCTTKDLVKSTIRIHHGATQASKIILPVLK